MDTEKIKYLLTGKFNGHHSQAVWSVNFLISSCGRSPEFESWQQMVNKINTILSVYICDHQSRRLLFFCQKTHIFSRYLLYGSSIFMLFLLRPSTKPCYRDVMMHAPNFLSRGRGKTLRQECLTCDEKRGEGKGKTDHQPLDKKWTSKLIFDLFLFYTFFELIF